MIVQEILNQKSMCLKRFGIESARLDVEIIVSHVLEIDRSEVYKNFSRQVSRSEQILIDDLIERRTQGEPIAYLIGIKGFYKDNFIVTRDVFVPRPETEKIVEEAILFLSSRQLKDKQYVADFGGGSGCIGLSVIKECPNAYLYYFDLSYHAVVIAQKNARLLGVQERCCFVCSDLLKKKNYNWLKKTFDVVVSNPPYIDQKDDKLEANVRNHEPHLALFSNQGLEHISSWAKLASWVLNPGGLCLFEMGSDQEEAVKEIFKIQFKSDRVEILKDLAGHPRVAKAFCRG